MHRALADDPEFVARFTREAKAAARLSSPDVVAVHDQGTDPDSGLAYLVMEHIRGGTLRDLVREQGAQSPARAVALMRPVLRALAAAHAAGLVHRDVKPENVLLGEDGRIKVADFGLARAIEASTLTATTGLLLGTAAYLSPEQVQHGAVDTRSDVYAAGVVLWELLTGTPPYGGDSAISLAYRHVHEDVPPPSTVVAGIPRVLDELVLRATRREPSARPVDAGAFLAELEAVAADLPVAVPVQPTLVVPVQQGPPPPPVRRPRRRRRRLPRLLALLVVLVAVAGAAFFLVGREPAIPSVLERQPASARQALDRAGFRVVVGPARFDEEVPAGLVADQDPDPGTRREKGTTVTLTVSRGPDRRALPNVVGMSREQAARAVAAVGLRLGTVTQAFSDEPVGEVLRMGAKAGTALRPGSPVNVVVSKGPDLVPLPQVTGRSRDEAVRTLEAAGFRVTTTVVFSETAPAGRVASQQPSGATAPRGGTVALRISKGPELIEVPVLEGQARDDAVSALRALGLKTEVDSLPFGPGKVRGTRPGAGSKVRRSSTVTLFVF
jgi:serine/threonine-protein kinase